MAEHRSSVCFIVLLSYETFFIGKKKSQVFGITYGQGILYGQNVTIQSQRNMLVSIQASLRIQMTVDRLLYEYLQLLAVSLKKVVFMCC